MLATTAAASSAVIRGGQVMPKCEYTRVASSDMEARPNVPAANIRPIPRAGEPGTSSVPSGSALTTANSNEAIATMTNGNPTHSTWWPKATAIPLGIIKIGRAHV